MNPHEKDLSQPTSKRILWPHALDDASSLKDYVKHASDRVADIVTVRRDAYTDTITKTDYDTMISIVKEQRETILRMTLQLSKWIKENEL
jgi:hypothetical protein